MELLPAFEVEQLRKQLHCLRNTADRVCKVGLNTHGRDYVIGDVHGSFDLVLSQMRAANFDRAHDRLFSLGDLIDRGTGSTRAAKFLDQPYVRAVSGNHEWDLVDLYLQESEPEQIVEAMARLDWNGARWLASTTPQQRVDLLLRFAQISLVMEVETARGSVGLLHGEVPAGMHWSDFVGAIKSGDEAAVFACLKGRKRIDSASDERVPGIDRIFVGHTTQRNGVRRYGNIFAIDTGAVFLEMNRRVDAGLTFANIAACTESLVNRVPTAGPLVEQGEGEFGNFAQPMG